MNPYLNIKAIRYPPNYLNTRLNVLIHISNNSNVVFFNPLAPQNFPNQLPGNPIIRFLQVYEDHVQVFLSLPIFFYDLSDSENRLHGGSTGHKAKLVFPNASP